jgi:hypothetical protein
MIRLVELPLQDAEKNDFFPRIRIRRHLFGKTLRIRD